MRQKKEDFDAEQLEAESVDKALRNSEKKSPHQREVIEGGFDPEKSKGNDENSAL